MGRWRAQVLDERSVEAGAVFGEPSAVLARLDDGSCIVAEDQALVRVLPDGRELWRTSCTDLTRFGATRPHAAHASGDRLLVLTDTVAYHSWGFLGPALLLDLAKGRVVAEMMGQDGAALSDGRFVLGLEGYGSFNTWLYDRDGTRLATWESFGHYVVDPDGAVRVVECDRTIPTSARVVRLLPDDGGMHLGPRLRCCMVAAPVVLCDGTIVMLDGGVLRAVDRDLAEYALATLLTLPPGGDHGLLARLRLEEDRLHVFARERDESATRHWTLMLLPTPEVAVAGDEQVFEILGGPVCSQASRRPVWRNGTSLRCFPDLRVEGMPVPQQVHELPLEPFPVIDDFEVRLERPAPSNTGYHVRFFSARRGWLATMRCWDHADRVLRANWFRVPHGELTRPFKAVEQGWEIVIGEHEPYVYVLEGRRKPDSSYHTWFRVRADRYRRAWQTAVDAALAASLE